jgi:hypothetical protein
MWLLMELLKRLPGKTPWRGPNLPAMPWWAANAATSLRIMATTRERSRAPRPPVRCLYAALYGAGARSV